MAQYNRPIYFDRSTALLMVLDASFVLLIIAGYGIIRDSNPFSILTRSPWLMALAILFPALFYFTGLYNLKLRWTSPAMWIRVLITLALGASFFGCVFSLTCRTTNIAGFFSLVVITLFAEVIVARNIAASRTGVKPPKKKALIIGAGWAGQLTVETIMRKPQLGIKVAGMIDDDPHKKNFTFKGVPVLGGGKQLSAAVESRNIDLIILAASNNHESEIFKNLLHHKMEGVQVVDMPRFYESVAGQIPLTHVEDSWFIQTGGFEILHRSLVRKVKRVIDVVASLLGLLLSLPLMAVVALVVKIDSRGPLFFRQERVGLNEKPFQLIKFRSMISNAEVETGPVWASESDYRVTRAGRWLRRTRLDEIPQFINVLKGDMSFIGPRPERPFFVEQLKKRIPYYSLRFTVKPGVTGWAQVRYHYGASTEDALEKLKYDLYYIKNMSWRLDFIIMVRTMGVVLFSKGS
jgi:sugar transferase (PEP-CTERM system associated)